jgi:hypothetical protein
MAEKHHRREAGTMIRINCIVEGQTEETFVKECLAPSLGQTGHFLSARCVETGRKRGKVFRGGLLSYQKARADIVAWLKHDQSAFVTTMFDYYRLPDDFPGYKFATGKQKPAEKANILESALAADICSDRFVPYIQMHEFEGLLFSDAAVMESVLKPLPRKISRVALSDIRNQYDTPEHINDGPETAPSKRLLSMYTGYDKILHGSLIASRIGLSTIQKECETFDRWIGRMQQLRT